MAVVVDLPDPSRCCEEYARLSWDIRRTWQV